MRGVVLGGIPWYSVAGFEREPGRSRTVAVRKHCPPAESKGADVNPLNEPRRALVTGASSGIGAALARRLAGRGIEVWLAARRQAALEQLAAEIIAAGGRAHSIVLDISRLDETHDRLAELDRDAGGIDLVVANAALAGAAAAKRLADSTWPEIRDILSTDLTGSVATLVPFIPGMLARGHGHLVGISSIAADVTNPRANPYGAAKAGFTMFLETADIELRPRGIAVTIVHPGFVRTPATDSLDDPLPFLVPLERAIDAIDAGIRSRALYVRFPWQLHLLVGLQRLLPRRIRHPLIRLATAERGRR